MSEDMVLHQRWSAPLGEHLSKGSITRWVGGKLFEFRYWLYSNVVEFEIGSLDMDNLGVLYDCLGMERRPSEGFTMKDAERFVDETLVPLVVRAVDGR